MFDLSETQQNAALKINAWFKEQSDLLDPKWGDPQQLTKPIFRVFGYAGTGKTTIIRHIMDQLEIRGDTFFAAFTGKAAMVMRRTGLPAQTIHSLIYTPVPPDPIECDKLLKAMNAETDPEAKGLLKAQLREKQQVHFVLKNKSDSVLRKAKLLVLDECSMVNDQMLIDLLSFNTPMLVLGDPGQLPPVEGEGALTREKPDVMLTEIHRQAKGNPIIDFATRARNGITLPQISIGNSAAVSQLSLKSDQVLAFDQIITGKNASRFKLNSRVRGLKGYSGLYPNVGEKLICLKNNVVHGLFNGMICEVVEVGELYDTSVALKIKREIDNDKDPPIELRALRAHFEVYQDPKALEGVRWWDRDGVDEFDFGYAITVHKAQGSQWDRVLLWDDKMFIGWNRKDRPKWLYTGITRAIESVVIAT